LGVVALAVLLGFLAVARLSRIITIDKIGEPIRRRVVQKKGETSLASYFIHCPWCTSIWISLIVMPAATLPFMLNSPLWLQSTLLTLLSIPAASHIAGMLNKE
jgi:hypothetical protein